MGDKSLEKFNTKYKKLHCAQKKSHDNVASAIVAKVSSEVCWMFLVCISLCAGGGGRSE